MISVRLFIQLNFYIELRRVTIKHCILWSLFEVCTEYIDKLSINSKNFSLIPSINYKDEINLN